MLAGKVVFARRAVLVLVLLVLVCNASGCGRRRRPQSMAEQGATTTARITRQRYFHDEEAERVYIYAEVKNFGPKTTKRLMITARLLSASRTTRGMNNYYLPGLKPGEARRFSMSVMKHPGPFDSIELSVAPADAPPK